MFGLLLSFKFQSCAPRTQAVITSCRTRDFQTLFCKTKPRAADKNHEATKRASGAHQLSNFEWGRQTRWEHGCTRNGKVKGTVRRVLYELKRGSRKKRSNQSQKRTFSERLLPVPIFPFPDPSVSACQHCSLRHFFGSLNFKKGFESMHFEMRGTTGRIGVV